MWVEIFNAFQLQKFDKWIDISHRYHIRMQACLMITHSIIKIPWKKSDVNHKICRSEILKSILLYWYSPRFLFLILAFLTYCIAYYWSAWPMENPPEFAIADANLVYKTRLIKNWGNKKDSSNFATYELHCNHEQWEYLVLWLPID